MKSTTPRFRARYLDLMVREGECLEIEGPAIHECLTEDGEGGICAERLEAALRVSHPWNDRASNDLVRKPTPPNAIEGLLDIGLRTFDVARTDRDGSLAGDNRVEHLRQLICRDGSVRVHHYADVTSCGQHAHADSVPLTAILGDAYIA